MIRLDKFLADMNMGTRSVLKKDIRSGQVCVNGVTVKVPETKICEQDQVTYQGNPVSYQHFFYYMLNKPAGCISATTDEREKTVLELLKEENCKDLFPVGRLDKDTEGLLLLTNDGALAHALLSPKKHVAKTYFVALLTPVTREELLPLETGVDIGEKRQTLPASVELLSPNTLHITITEGKYHQVKRMFKAVGNQVTYLKRLSMGSLRLDESLKTGEYRSLTKQELKELRGEAVCCRI